MADGVSAEGGSGEDAVLATLLRSPPSLISH
jgi:hypothetical protein